MTNREKYQEKLLDIALQGKCVALLHGEPHACTDIYCPDCDMFEICEADEDAEAAYRQEWAETEAE